VTYDALAKKAPLDSVIGWNGSAIYRNGGSHLGIFMNSMKFTTRGDIMITQGGAGGRDSRGWGFGRQARVDKEQGYSWEGNALKGPVAFEIAVKAGELTDEEQKVLLTDSKIQQP
jgi:hypothetical protein